MLSVVALTEPRGERIGVRDSVRRKNAIKVAAAAAGRGEYPLETFSLRGCALDLSFLWRFIGHSPLVSSYVIQTLKICEPVLSVTSTFSSK